VYRDREDIQRMFSLSFSSSLSSLFSLSGSPPFHEERSLSLFKQIEQGSYEFPHNQWHNISAEGKKREEKREKEKKEKIHIEGEKCTKEGEETSSS
jgi:hypothetical protein